MSLDRLLRVLIGSPSPKFQLYDTIVWPGAGLDVLASKNVSTLATTGVGEKTKAAAGAEPGPTVT